MDKVTAYHCVRLSELPGVGPRAIARILALNRSRRRTLDEFFQQAEEVYRDDYRLPPRAVACLVHERNAYETRCAALADHLTESGGVALLAGAPGYPPAWEACLEAPPAIAFGLGDTGLLQSPAVAVLNSRMLSSDSIVATRAIVAAAAREGDAAFLPCPAPRPKATSS